MEDDEKPPPPNAYVPVGQENDDQENTATKKKKANAEHRNPSAPGASARAKKGNSHSDTHRYVT